MNGFWTVPQDRGDCLEIVLDDSGLDDLVAREKDLVQIGERDLVLIDDHAGPLHGRNPVPDIA